jgi:hypothetical protein
MIGSAIRTCEPAFGRNGGRKSLTFQIRSYDDVVVEDSHLTQLGLAPEQAQAAQVRFAARLAALVGEVMACRNLLPQDAAASTPSGRPGGLDPSLAEKFLEDLRDLGAGLWGALSGDFIARARDCGLPAAAEACPPALAFFEQQAPILWEMIYEGKRAQDLDWRRFWGFRYPITHWVVRRGLPHPPAQVLVRNGLFSAVSEDLGCAGAEVTALVERLEQQVRGLGHDNLSRALRQRVCRERTGGVDGAEWFRGHLAGKSQLEQKRWKDRALVEILTEARSRYELFHFACHGDADRLSELYTRLVMKVAGEALLLDVGLLLSDLAEAGGLGPGPRPLVFLNACSTSQPSPAGEPPGFPEAWIKCGAAAVIATLCPVPDRFAHAFAEAFYENLFRGGQAPGQAVSCGDLAEALLTTRCQFMDRDHNPLGLAYVLYARKGTRVLLDESLPSRSSGG